MHPVAAGHVDALVLTITAASGETTGPVRLSKAPQPCFGAGSCDVFEVTAGNKLGTLQHAQVRQLVQGIHQRHLSAHPAGLFTSRMSSQSGSSIRCM